MAEQSGTLYLIPTPVGNLEDITQRALRILREVDLIACEDTRHSGRLLKQFDIEKRLTSYHDFNEQKRSSQLLDALRNGESVAVVTDAGSPGISDPAYRVVRAAIDAGVEVVALPGATSVIPALTASGLPTDRFFFEGFLPHKSGARRTRLGQLAELEHTLLFFESPFRVEKTLSDMRDTLGDRQACVAREISKLHEEYLRGSLSEIISRISGKNVKGEIVIVVGGFDRKTRKAAEE